MSWNFLIGIVTSLLNHRSTKPLGLALLILIMGVCMTQLYAKLSVPVNGFAKHETRILELEKGDVGTKEQLKSINASLQRIETMTAEQRRDMSELKIALIKR